MLRLVSTGGGGERERKPRGRSSWGQRSVSQGATSGLKPEARVGPALVKSWENAPGPGNCTRETRQ